TTRTQAPAGGAFAPEKATSFFTSNDASVRLSRSGSDSEQPSAPGSGERSSTVRWTSLTNGLSDMSSSCESTHLTSWVPSARGANGAHGRGAALSSVSGSIAPRPAGSPPSKGHSLSRPQPQYG